MGLFFFALAAAATTASVIESSKARKAARRAAESDRRAQNIRATRERAQVIREAYIQSGSVAQQAENQGIATSSAAQGAQSSVQSQLAGNLSFLDRYNGEIRRGDRFRDRAMRYQGNAALWSGVSDLALMGAQMSQSASSGGSSGGG